MVVTFLSGAIIVVSFCLIGSIIMIVLLAFLTPWVVRKREDLIKPVFVYSPDGVEYERFPSLLLPSDSSHPQHTPPDLYLSVIIPAMNEAKRLIPMLTECVDYLEGRTKANKSFTYEVIVVDDGSSDNTADVAFGFSQTAAGSCVKVLRLRQNRGKGGAVRCGILHARGSMILFVDADGATKFADFSKVEESLLRATMEDNTLPKDRFSFDWSFPAVSIGSRAHMEMESIATRSIGRTFLMIGFHFLVYIFAVRTIRDTQCGFKLFTRAAAAKLFPILHIERWAFDVEILYLAEKFRYPIEEVAVNWHEVEGSKIVPIRSWIEMGRDLILIWFRYSTGIWRHQIAT
ncbi:hypothetical protein AB6A40_004838 [Gnathostoma spinigerum]|uniref:dolichyl-phosphate beta-glucosyltransferase n=1 Tax=Gnathostoma spinigerum TaxID=75299 RepID=A0ABD6EJ17_9BILA